MFFDTHAHYDSDRFDNDRSAVLSALPGLGVDLVIDPGCDEVSSKAAVALAEEYAFLYAAVGWQPQELKESYYDGALDVIRQLAAHPKVVAIGEIGLDYYWDTSYNEFQQEILREQFRLAEELDLPVIFHDREAHGDSLAIVRERGKCGMVRAVTRDWEERECSHFSAERISFSARPDGFWIWWCSACCGWCAVCR